MYLPSLKNQRIAIIGGSSGIGYGVAECALAEGAQVVIASSNPANVDAAVARLGQGASGGVVNVSDEASVAAFFDGLGAFDHLVFTAGKLNRSAFSRCEPSAKRLQANLVTSRNIFSALRRYRVHALIAIAATNDVPV